MRVLAVDDDENIRLVLRTYLEFRGHDGTVVGTAAAARQACTDEVFDLALVDVSLPDGSGVDLVRELGAAGHQPAHVVLLTGLTPGAVAAAADGLAVSHLRKPFTIADLDGHLADVLPG